MSDDQAGQLPPTHDGLSLEQIQADHWDPPPADATALMTRVFHARRKPLNLLSTEDLRVLIAHGEGLEILVPQALARLEQDPLLEGDYYPGDLLTAVLDTATSYWEANPTDLTQLEAIIASIQPIEPALQGDINAFHNRIRS